MLVEVIDDLKKKDITDFIKAATVVGKMLATIETDLTDCAGMKPDLLRIKAWAVIFKHPLKLFNTMFTNTLMNLDALEGDVSNIMMDVMNQDFHDIGEQVADILVT